MAAEPPVHILLDLAKAASEMKQFPLLDTVWAGVSRQGDLGERDREAVVTMASNMDAQLALLERHAYNLRDIFESYPDWLNEKVRSELGGHRISPSLSEEVRRILNDAPRLLKVENDDFASRGVTLADSLAHLAPAIREELRRKIPALRGDGPVVTEMFQATACTVMGLVTLTELALCGVTAGAGCVFAIGGILVLAALDC